MQKAYFLSHGSPTLPLDNVAARNFFMKLGDNIPKPDAILAVSAHWETDVPTINLQKTNETIHDFYGFQRELYEMQYPAKGSEALTNRVRDLLGEAGMNSKIDEHRGLDHGAWVPLKLMYPQADIPVAQLSIQSHLGPGHHLEVGRALAKLREENVMIMASGSFTHNLRQIKWRGGAEEDWSKQFSDWFDRALTEGRTCDLLSYRRLAPFAQTAHPTDEHLLPVFVAMGAAYPDIKAERLHSSTTFGSLRMDSYSFG